MQRYFFENVPIGVWFHMIAQMRSMGYYSKNQPPVDDPYNLQLSGPGEDCVDRT